MKITSIEALTAILLGGAIAGAIDIVAASLIYLQNPARILQTIAGGLLAKASYNGGVATVFFGVLLQESMGIVIAAIYFLISALLPPWRRYWIASGVAAGVTIFYVMNYVVVPLSAWKSKPHFSFDGFVENLAAMLLFGLIVAFFCCRLDSSDQQMQAAKTPT